MWARWACRETVFQAFVKTIGIYPIGSLVRLKSGRLAVVNDQSEKSLLTPKVKVFFSTKSKGPIKREVIDLSRSQDRIEGLEDVAVWGVRFEKGDGNLTRQMPQLPGGLIQRFGFFRFIRA